MALPIAVATGSPTPNLASALPVAVTLDGTGSFDPDGHAITAYHWTFVDKPSGSAATLSSLTASNPTFTADVVGNYRFFLWVESADPVPADAESARVLREAPSSAFVEIVVTTANLELELPAKGSRSWHRRMNGNLLTLDSDLGPVVSGFSSHIFARTTSNTARFQFLDQRGSGSWDTSDHLLAINPANANYTPVSNYGLILLDDIGTGAFAFEMPSGVAKGNFALLKGQAVGLHMYNLSGSQQIGLRMGNSNDLTQGIGVFASWVESGTNGFTLLSQSNADRAVSSRIRWNVENDPGTSDPRLYLNFVRTAGSEELRVRFDQHRVHMRRDLWVELDPGAPSPYQEDWDLYFYRNGESDHGLIGYREDIKGFVAKQAESGAVEHAIAVGTGALVTTRVDRGTAFVFYNPGLLVEDYIGEIRFNVAFSAAPTVTASIRTGSADAVGIGLYPIGHRIERVDGQKASLILAVIADHKADLNEGVDFWIVDWIAVGEI